MSVSEKKYAQISNYCRLITLNYTDTACLTMKNYPPLCILLSYTEGPSYR